MISIFLFYSTFLMSVKEFYVHSTLIMLDYPALFIILIFPLVYFVIFTSFFSKLSKKDSLFFNMTFFFFFFFLFFCFSLSSSILFLVSLECSACLMIFFIFNYAKDSDKISSSIFMFIINVMGSIPFLFFCIHLWLSNFLNFEGVSFCSIIFFFCFSFLLCSKLPIFLLHFWLTKAHVSASGCGSMILASLMLKMGCMGFVKWGSFFSFMYIKFLTSFLSFFSITGLMILFLMNRFFDLKYLVACSSISHMSFTFPFFLMNSSTSFFSSCVMMVSHGVTSCLVFFLVSYLYEVNQDRSISSSKSLESYSYSLSLFVVLWLILNLGFPPFVSFVSEMLFLFTLNEISIFFSLIFILSLIFSGLYFINLLMNLIFFKKNSFCVNGLMIIPGSSCFFLLFSFFSLSFFF